MAGWMIGVAGALALVLILLLLRRRRAPVAADSPHFRRTGSLLGRGEAAFMELLKEATGDQFRIYPKIGLGGLVTPQSVAADGSETGEPWPAALAGSCADFVLCSKDDYAVIAVIALRPAPAQGEAGALLLDPLDDALAAAEISVARFESGRHYSVNEVQKHLADCLSLPVKVFGQATHRLAEKSASGLSAKPAQRSADGSPLCPECGAAMAQRRANQGKFAGKLFWVCSRFPGCRKVVPVTG